MQTIKLSLAELVLCSPQQLVLAQRHGLQDEPENNEFAFRQQWYRAMPELTDREIRFTFTAQYGDRVFEISMRRFYHHDGALYRLSLVDQDGAAVRKRGPKQREVNLLALAGYLSSQHYGGAPSDLRYLMRVRGNDDAIPIQRAELYSVQMPDEKDAAAFLEAKLQALSEALDSGDAPLPECDSEQQHTTGPDARGCLSAEAPFRLRLHEDRLFANGVPRKCIDWCPVRHHCRQRAAYLARNASVLEGVVFE